MVQSLAASTQRFAHLSVITGSSTARPVQGPATVASRSAWCLVLSGMSARLAGPEARSAHVASGAGLGGAGSLVGPALDGTLLQGPVGEGVFPSGGQVATPGGSSVRCCPLIWLVDE